MPQGTPKPPPVVSAHQPHDKLFKALFKTPAHVQEVLNACAPQALLDALLLDSLRVTDASFVDPNLAGGIADIVLECQTSSGSRACISFILEHKSTVPRHAPYQVMQYQLNAWGQQLRSDSAPGPIPVIPILFYHGTETWQVRPWKDYILGWEEAFDPFTPLGGYLFIDLSELPDERIRSFRSAFLKTALLLMKHRTNSSYLLTNLVQILNFVESDERLDPDVKVELLRILLRYVQSLKDVQWSKVKQILYPLTLTHQVMSVLEEIKLEVYQETYQEAYQEGQEAGREEGREEGIDLEARTSIRSVIAHLPDATDEFIADLLSKPIELVAEVRQAMIEGAEIRTEEEE